MDQPQPLAAIATRLGVTARTLHNHARKDGFPTPALTCGTCGNGLLYDVDAVTRWETDPENAPVGADEPAVAQPLAAIAEHLDRSLETLRKHSRRPDFPAPLARCGKCGGAAAFDEDAVRRYEEGAPVDPSDQLVTLQQAADELELSYGSLRTYLGRHPDFPRPFKRSGLSPLFSLNQIRAWQNKRMTTHRKAAVASAGEAHEVDGMLTRAGVAAELGVKIDTVTRYQRRDTDFSKDFPLPARTIGRSRLWDPEQIRSWRASRPRS